MITYNCQRRGLGGAEAWVLINSEQRRFWFAVSADFRWLKHQLNSLLFSLGEIASTSLFGFFFPPRCAKPSIIVHNYNNKKTTYRITTVFCFLFIHLFTQSKQLLRDQHFAVAPWFTGKSKSIWHNQTKAVENYCRGRVGLQRAKQCQRRPQRHNPNAPLPLTPSHLAASYRETNPSCGHSKVRQCAQFVPHTPA